jgi:hypothetical protein
MHRNPRKLRWFPWQDEEAAAKEESPACLAIGKLVSRGWNQQIIGLLYSLTGWESCIYI